jgi:hypothetical protein
VCLLIVDDDGGVLFLLGCDALSGLVYKENIIIYVWLILLHMNVQQICWIIRPSYIVVIYDILEQQYVLRASHNTNTHIQNQYQT